MRALLLTSLCSLLLLACGNKIKTGKDLKIVGKTIQEINSYYGTPNNTKNIKLTKGIDLLEYQSCLHNYIPANENETLLLIEMKFSEKQKGKNLVVWLTPQDGGLKVIDALQWPVGIVF